MELELSTYILPVVWEESSIAHLKSYRHFTITDVREYGLDTWFCFLFMPLKWRLDNSPKLLVSRINSIAYWKQALR